jgi:hypothetical protein
MEPGGGVMSATSRHRIAGASLHDLEASLRDARETARQLSDEIAALHANGRGTDPLLDQLVIDHQTVMTRIKRLDGLISAAENDLDAEQWL